jgi:predicted alpha/beta-fold hydrolase
LKATPYIPVSYLKGQHLETIIPNLFRKQKKIVPEQIKIDTPDGDFLQLDLYKKGSNSLVILSHGLEGSSDRVYITGMAKIFLEHNIDALAWNYRGCGSELNTQPRLYHSGATDDLNTVVNHAISLGYEKIILVGVSLGGNLTLKYVGENGENLAKQVKMAITFSTPLDLAAGCRQISTPGNWMYSKRFIFNLKKKVRIKNRQFPDKFSLSRLHEVQDLWTFDDIYTGPVHGFEGAEDYYEKCSAVKFLTDIQIPTLIVNALNDPFLPAECYPYELMSQNINITFETPEHGGHVGFMEINEQGYYWSEKRALAFVKQFSN